MFAVSSEDGEIITIPVDAQGSPLEPKTSALDGVKDAFEENR